MPLPVAEIILIRTVTVKKAIAVKIATRTSTGMTVEKEMANLPGLPLCPFIVKRPCEKA
jgi:hypothetical protein